MSASAAAFRLPGAGQLALIGLAAGYTVASWVIVPDRGGPTTTYATTLPAEVVLAGVGAGLVVVGIATWLTGTRRAPGVLTVLVGVAWLAPIWIGWHEGAPLARSLGAVAAPFLLPALVHLALAVPSGRLDATATRGLAALGWVSAAMGAVGQALFRNPLHDIRCWSDCETVNVFLVSSNIPLARTIGTSWLWLSMALSVVVVAWATWQLVAATRSWRAMASATLVPAIVAIAGEGGYAAARLGRADALRSAPVEPAHAEFLWTFFARGVALGSLAAGLGWVLVRERRRHAAVVRLAEDLGGTPSPGSLRAALAASLGDPWVQVGYWLPSMNAWVDATGRPLPAPADDDRVETEIRRDQQPVAVVRHDPGLADSPELTTLLGSSARLAIDNERLGAEVLAYLEHVRASRARIVEAGDDARRRLERDLHDGAQQRLLAVSYELRLARADAADDPALTTVLDSALGETLTALTELRELAHGIFPAILEEAGLGPALWSLADMAPVAVEIVEVPERRLPVGVERSAYLVVAEAIAATTPGWGTLHVSLELHPGSLTVEVADATDAPYVHASDRVGAFGGMLSMDDGVLRAEIPCE